MSKGKRKNMLDIRNIIHRLREGQSNRRIERETGIDRDIVRKIKKLSIDQAWLDCSVPMPTDEAIAICWKPGIKTQRHHFLDPYRTDLEQWYKEGHSAVVMYQLLKDKCSCNPQSIRRYLSKYFSKQIQPVMVRPTTPGKEIDIDFGYLGEFLDQDGEKRKAWLFSLRLRHSRLAYRKVVLNQKSQTFLSAHIHAFEWFGGVPKYVILDNCKAGVIQSTTDNDMIQRSYQELAEHYGFLISPCLPRTPEHKGGVEGDVKYVKRNFLPYFLEKQKEGNIKIPSVEELKKALKSWEDEIANTHLIHGVGRSPLALFEEEKKELHSLPKTRWELTSWSQCAVRKDWRIMHDSAYYSVPYQFIGKTVQVCTTESLVRIFYDHQEVAYHEKAKKKWEYKRKSEYAPPLQENVLNCSRAGLLSLAETVGPFTYQVVEAILSHPSIDKLRPARVLLRLADKYSKERLENACRRAHSYKMFSYKSVKNILENNLDSQKIQTVHETKIIPIQQFRFARDPSIYKSNESFEERLANYHTSSKYGYAFLGAYTGGLADQILEEEIKLSQTKGTEHNYETNSQIETT